MDAIIDYRGKTPTKTTSGVPLVTAKIVKAGRIEEPTEFIAAEAFEAWMRRGLPEPGDIVMTTEAPLGEVAQLDGRKVALAQRLIGLRGKRGELDNTFLKYMMQSAFVQQQLHARASGTTVLGIRQSELREVRLVLPAFDEQRSIADILRSLDDKIELNRQMNRTLEALAATIFKSWFVDFDPVVAKADGRAPFGMSADVASLFPSSWEPSEDGPIPAGWRVGMLSEIAAVNEHSVARGYPHQSIEYVDISSVSRGRLQASTTMEFAAAPSRARRLVRDGDTIWSCVRPNLKAYLLICEPSPNTVVSTGFAVLGPKLQCPAFLHAAVTTDDFVEYLTAVAEGSAYPAVRADLFGRAPIVVPASQVITAFEQVAWPLFKKTAQNDRESRALAELRDTLLPKLLTGEIRVKQAERALAEV